MPLFVCVCVFKSPSVYWLCRMIYKNHSHKLSHAPHTKTACKYLNIYQYINTAFIITTTKPSQAVRFENVNIEWTLKHSKYSHILDWRYNKKIMRMITELLNDLRCVKGQFDMQKTFILHRFCWSFEFSFLFVLF